jgi:hypothetical protein
MKGEAAVSRSRWPWLVAAVCLFAVLIGLLLPRQDTSAKSTGAPGQASATAANSQTAAGAGSARLSRRGSSSVPGRTAEEIVAAKVTQFGQSRREIARAVARRSKKDVLPEVEKFFDAIESGRWEDIRAQFHELAVRSYQYDYSTNHWPELDPFWPAVLDAYGVAEEAHLWPPQQLLDYGDAVLGSLRPGMVYVGGTDPGRWIPELLNETGGGEQHIIVTQNALADGRYLEYMGTLYGDKFAALTQEDTQRAFSDYTTDAQKRLQHDQQFPDDPKQVRPGENITMVDGRVQISGQVAVMAINEKLLQTLMQKNPDLSFAMEESFSLPSMYVGAAPLGPLMELRAQGGQEALTADNAAQSVAYWQTAAQQLLSDPEVSGSTNTLKTYSHDAQAQANLLAAQNFTTEAEQTYRTAMQLWPGSGEAVSGLTRLLATTGRAAEANQLLDSFVQNNPDQRSAIDAFRKTLVPAATPAQSPSR